EDGIRAFHVTGVQTCALPISLLSAPVALAQKTTVADPTVQEPAPTAEPAAPKPPPYSIPFGLRPALAVNVVRLDSALGFFEDPRWAERRVGAGARSPFLAIH